MLLSGDVIAVGEFCEIWYHELYQNYYGYTSTDTRPTTPSASNRTAP
jgi:hypothetical protein